MSAGYLADVNSGLLLLGDENLSSSRKCLRHVCDMSADETFFGGFEQTFEPCQ
jgi:hypothetical protein